MISKTESPHDRYMRRRKEAADEASRRALESNGKVSYARSLADVHKERGIRWPERFPETSSEEDAPPAPRIPQPVLESLVNEAVRRVLAAGGTHKMSYEKALSDVRKERGIPSV